MLKYTSQQTSPGLYSTSTQLVLNSGNGFNNYIVLQEGSPQSIVEEKRQMSNSSAMGISKLNRYQFSQSSIQVLDSTKQDQQYNCASQQLKFTIESTQHSVTQQMTDERQKNPIETTAFEVKMHRSQSMLISGSHYNPDRTRKSSLKKAKQQPQFHSHRNEDHREASNSLQSEQPIPSISSASKKMNERCNSTTNQLISNNCFAHHQKNQSHNGQQTAVSHLVHSPQVTQVKNEIATPKNDMTMSQIRKVKENGFVNAIAISTPKSIIVHKTIQQTVNSVKKQDLEKYDGIWSKKFQELEIKFMSLFQETIQQNQLLKQKVTFDDQKKEENEQQRYNRLQDQFQDLSIKYKEILQIQKQLKKQVKQNQVVDQSTYYASVIQSKDIEIDNLKRQLSQNMTNLRKDSGTNDVNFNKLEEQIKLYEKKIQNLELDLQNKLQLQEQQQAETNFIKQENLNLKKELQDKDKIVSQLRNQLDNQNTEINKLMNQNEYSPDTKIQKLKNQLTLWKDKFLNLNRIQMFKKNEIVKPNGKKLTFNI